jgi:hypothetical protein
MLVGTSSDVDSVQANLGMCLLLYSIGMVVYLLFKKPKPKPKQQVIIQQIQTDKEGDDIVTTQNVNVEQNASVGKLEVKRGMKKDNQIFKLIKLGMILGAFIGVAIMGMETVKSLALVILIVLGCIIALFLFIALPLMIVFKDTIKLFISKKN